MNNKKYWTSLDELNETPQYKEEASKEFNFEIPSEDEQQKEPNRRDFLKAMGFSVSAAAIASACKIPTHKAIPYTFDLRDAASEVIPGVAEYFASSYYDSGEFSSILVKTREGRPIKIEANPKAPYSNGTNAKAQAMVLSLYDVARLKNPIKNNKKVSWSNLDKDIITQLNDVVAGGGKIALVTNTNLSTITNKAIAQFKAKYPSTDVVVYDPISASAQRKASGGIIPSYNFDKAEVIVGFNCDFIGTWMNPEENTSKYITNRVPTKDNPKMSRHHQFQSTMTITGANADYRYPIKPSEEKQALANLYTALGGSTSTKKLSHPDADKGIAKVAKELKASQGKALVVSGTNDVEIQGLVNAINAQIGSYGNTIDTGNTLNFKQGNDEALAQLVANLNTYQAIILVGANPVYDTPYANQFKEALKKAKLSISTSTRIDESSQYCQFVAPNAHILESWDVIEPKKGFYGFVQPTIVNIFDTRQEAASLFTWTGLIDTIDKLVQDEIALVSGKSYQSALQDGFADKTVASGASSLPSTTSITASNPKGMEVYFYEKIAIGDGKNANNPLLQEMPDPISKATWDNYVTIPYSYAQDLGIDVMPADKHVPIAEVTVGKQTYKLPVVVQFGQAPNTLGIALGYGREKAGAAAEGVGQNVYPSVKFSNGANAYSADGATFKIVGKNYKLALNQTYHTLMEDVALPGKPLRYRGMVVKETTLKDYAKNEHAGNEDREKIQHHLVTMYPTPQFPGHHWGMIVDMNACTGCGACVVSCNIENNVPVVGKRQVYRSQEMHWLRIDRYYNGNPDNPDVAFQPMMCQHCDNAPCENVCPVNATNHSSEGINQMAYNRCIGTRYCANNCPYKVRRFNWLDYQGNDMFGKFNDGTPGWGGVETAYMFEDLTRMVLNPDVVVRTRGVIEKCSFCTQRIQEGKLQAKKENRKLNDGDIKVACQSACPTNAIVFGDMNDKESEVAKIMETGRNYFIFEEQHFLPHVGYQVKIRNKDEEPVRGFIHQEEEFKS